MPYHLYAKKVLFVLCVAVVVLHSYNFIAMEWYKQQLGGSALDGYERNGRYYVIVHDKIDKSRDNRALPVSEADWKRCRLHEISFFFLFPLMFGAALYLQISDLHPRIIFRGEEAPRKKKEEVVRTQGVLRANFNYGGYMAWLNLRRLQISVFSSGVHFSVPTLLGFAHSFAILPEEIKIVKVKPHLHTRVVEIVHTSPEVVSPIVLYTSNPEQIVAHLRALQEQAKVVS